MGKHHGVAGWSSCAVCHRPTRHDHPFCRRHLGLLGHLDDLAKRQTGKGTRRRYIREQAWTPKVRRRG